MQEKDSAKPEPKSKILELAKKVPDSRSDKLKKHSLTSMIFIALVGTVCGADDWIAIAYTGEHLKD